MPEPTAPIACTLAPDLLPGRIRAFEELFAAHLAGVEHAPRLLRLRFGADAAGEATARDLFDRERACCAFASYDHARAADGRFTVEVGVPAGAEALLDELREAAGRAGPGAAVTALPGAPEGSR